MQFNQLKPYISISEINSIKRRTDKIENGIEMNNINEDVIIKKGPNGEITYKTIKNINNDSLENKGSKEEEKINNKTLIKNDNNLVSKKQEKSNSKNQNQKNNQNKQNNNISNRILTNIKKDKVIVTIVIGKNIDFNRNNYNYAWKNKDFITTFTKRFQKGNLIYLTCSKRGSNSNKCLGKAKGKIIIY